MNVLHEKGTRLLGYNSGIWMLDMTTATDCPSDKLNKCKITCGKCVAKMAEDNLNYGEKVLKSRSKRAKAWNDISEEELIKEIKEARKKGMWALRINSSGDFRNQEDVNKLYKVLETTKTPGFGWTSRDDLIFRESNYIFIRGSNFETWCGKSIILPNTGLCPTKQIKIPEGFILCPSAGLSINNKEKKQCKTCKLCISKKKIYIAFRELKQ